MLRLEANAADNSLLKHRNKQIFYASNIFWSDLTSSFETSDGVCFAAKIYVSLVSVLFVQDLDVSRLHLHRISRMCPGQRRYR